MRGAIVAALMASALGAACKESGPAETAETGKAGAVPAANAIEVALTLAQVRGLPGQHSDAEWIERYRVHCEVGCVALRRYRVAEAPTEATITPDELRHVLLTPPPAVGEIVELFERQPPFETLAAALLDPAAGIAGRTERLTGVGAEALAAQVRDVLHIDLAKREIDGASWVQDTPRDSSAVVTIVERVSDRATQIAIGDAQLLEPGARVGAQLAMRRSAREIRLPKPPLHAPGAVIVTTYREDFERMRALAAPMPTPEALAPLVTTPIYRLYPEASGVGFIEVPAREVTGLWKQLDEAAPRTGVRPLYLEGDRQDLLDARIAWRDPAPILEAIARVDLTATLRATGAAARGAWPTTTPARVWDFPTAIDHGEPTAFMLLVPTDAAWKVPAYVPHFAAYASGLAPDLATLAAVARRWETTYGAKLVALGSGLAQWYLGRPLSRVSATALALELFALAPHGREGTVEDLAASLVAGSPFTASWD